uniref:NADH-ubiquinone oxidoreductase chain 3 n=1 Tax=Panthalis oerstedi TaxID=318815 RepID=A0A343W6C8_9ANNE|nr:NADH dehydrogenase subunit 3 [Panthalis oerstedi]
MLFSSTSLLIAFLLPATVMFTALVISMRSFQDREKSSPFECGFDPKNNARLPFSLRFFLLAVIFLVFDIEIVLIMPAPILHNAISTPSTMSALLFFLLILILGLLHEWREGSLDWSSR